MKSNLLKEISILKPFDVQSWSHNIRYAFRFEIKKFYMNYFSILCITNSSIPYFIALYLFSGQGYEDQIYHIKNIKMRTTTLKTWMMRMFWTPLKCLQSDPEIWSVKWKMIRKSGNVKLSSRGQQFMTGIQCWIKICRIRL